MLADGGESVTCTGDCQPGSVEHTLRGACSKMGMWNFRAGDETDLVFCDGTFLIYRSRVNESNGDRL